MNPKGGQGLRGSANLVSKAFTAGPFQLRAARPEDADAIAALHVRVWRETYRDLATPEAYAALTEEVRRERWREALATQPVRHQTLVAEQQGRIVAFGSACAPTEPLFGDRGEVRWLHVDGEFSRRGLGRRLMSALAGQLRDWDYRGCALAVVEGNQPAIDFYDRLGGRRVGAFVDPGPLWRSSNLVFVWDDLTGLLELA